MVQIKETNYNKMIKELKMFIIMKMEGK